MADNYRGAHGRKFHSEFPSISQNEEEKESEYNPESSNFYFIRDNIIGKDLTFCGPFGDRKVLYCDYTASGRSLKYIEDYIQENVLPHYGNTHTTTSVTSLQTTMFRQEARDIIRKCVGANELDAVIFTGNGCTAAVNKLIHALNFQSPPIVFVSPYEHHSNLLPWKEIGGEIIWTKVDSDGFVDVLDLENNLKDYQSTTRPLIGCFTAASNITGVLVDTDKVAECLHRYNALAFFDYASAGPYVDISMNLKTCSGSYAYKDAIFISPHKFIGGPGTPGILIAKKSLFQNPIPDGGGGGTVFYVTANTHRYLKDVEMREEGGTPGIVESIRAGMVFQLKDNIRTDVICKREEELLRMAYTTLSSSSNLILLGPKTFQKIPILSFVIKHEPSGRLLHHNFVAVLLNDLFGIQSRSGCACAGPYAEYLIGLKEEVALQIEKLLLEDQRLDRHHLRRQREYSDKEMLRPGFTRINLPFFYENETIKFILQAILMIADHGWKLLPFYILNPETGEWRHRYHQIFKDRIWLGAIKFRNGCAVVPCKEESKPVKTRTELLVEAENLFYNIKVKDKCGDQTLLLGDDGEKYRWFLLPCEAEDYLNNEIPHSCRNFQMAFFPGWETGTFERLNTENLRASNSTCLNLHFCNCSPLHMNTLNDKNRDNCDVCDVTKIKDINLNLGNQRTLKEEMNHLNTTPSKKDEPASVCAIRKSKDSKEEHVDINSKELQDTRVLKFHSPSKMIFKPAVEAIEEFGMIRNNDRVLICLSGGKDSLSMLHVIHQYKFYAKSKGVIFDFGAMTVDPQSSGYDPSPLKDYLQGLGVPYFYEEQDIIGAAAQLPVCTSICSYCSRMKRGRIYACARTHAYNVIAIGQHLDDVAESFLMSTFHNGYLRTMKANYTVTDGDLRVIRPLIYVRERELRKFADKCKLPIITENCPACFESPKERYRMKQLLAQQEVLFPNLFSSLKSAVHPLLSKSKTGMEKQSVNDVTLDEGFDLI